MDIKNQCAKFDNQGRSRPEDGSSLYRRQLCVARTRLMSRCSGPHLGCTEFLSPSPCHLFPIRRIISRKWWLSYALRSPHPRGHLLGGRALNTLESRIDIHFKGTVCHSWCPRSELNPNQMCCLDIDFSTPLAAVTERSRL